MNMQQNTHVANESDAADISEVEQVLKELQTRNIKGRPRKVTRAEDKPASVFSRRPVRRFC